MPYSYVEYSNVIVAATNVGVNKTFDELYQIKEDVESPQYRLFVHGVSSPYVNRENLPTYEWIKSVTGYTPRKEYIFPLTDHNYGHLKTKYSDRNILILFCKPSNPDCLNLISGYLTDAVLFRNTRNSLFAYVDCSLYPHLCSIHFVSSYPSFRFLAPGAEFAVDEGLTSAHGENIIAYMNGKCGTRFLSGGSYDEWYGRNQQLDVLAHRFMDIENEDYRKSIMRQVKDLAPNIPEAARYFSLMKRIVTEGAQAILTELSYVKQELRSSRPGSKENKALSARMNVVHQFEKINTWKNLVSIHPWNIDFLLSKNHLLLLLTADACETCEDAVTVFTNLAKRGVRGIIVGHLNCKRYPDFCYRFHVESYPAVFFYYKGQNKDKPILVKEKLSLLSLRDYVEDTMDDFYGNGL